MRNIPRAQEMREEAIAAIESGGETAVRVRDIAAACGVTTPILYRAFGSREGLIVDAQVERYIRTWTAIGDLFLPSIVASTTVDELIDAIGSMLAAALAPERAHLRRIRASVMGSAISRPELMTALHSALEVVVDQVVAAFEVVRGRGLIRDDLDLRAGVWWYLGQMDGRLLVEQMPTGVSLDAWTGVARSAILALLLDEPR